jgi:hypothetical protein
VRFEPNRLLDDLLLLLQPGEVEDGVQKMRGRKLNLTERECTSRFVPSQSFLDLLHNRRGPRFLRLTASEIFLTLITKKTTVPRTPDSLKARLS